jgi:hypothetical protein
MAHLNELSYKFKSIIVGIALRSVFDLPFALWLYQNIIEIPFIVPHDRHSVPLIEVQIDCHHFSDLSTTRISY